MKEFICSGNRFYLQGSFNVIQPDSIFDYPIKKSQFLLYIYKTQKLYIQNTKK